MHLFRRVMIKRWGVDARVLLPLMLIAVDVWARAGGGGRYSGGGGSSGGGGGIGGGGGGGGDGLPIYLVFQLLRVWIHVCIRYPLLGIPLTILFAGVGGFALLKGGRNAQTYHQARTIHRGRVRQEDTARTEALSRLRERDPGFSEEAFLGRIQRAFLKIQDAWCHHKLEDVRAFISDGVYERFALQIQEQQEAGVRDHMERLNVDDIHLAQSESDRVFDTMTVAISATAVDYQVDSATGRFVSGSREPTPFTEYWSFIRRPGVRSLSGDGLIEGNCPNCGASLHLNEAAACAACGALIKSGEYDWVLAEITQACEWQVKSGTRIPGVAALSADDPGFSVQHIEDRASVMYWRLMAAWRSGKTELLRKVATDDFCERFAALVEPGPDGTRTIPSECAVGAVQLLGIRRDDPMDTALVEVRWSSAQAERTASGELRQSAASGVKTDIFMLVRGHAVRTDLSLALSSAHCSGCGAPTSGSTESACQYCGAVLNRGDHDWVLADRRPPFDQDVMEMRQQFAAMHAPGPGAVPGAAAATAPGGVEILAWMATVMLADGVVKPEELESIQAYAAKRGIPRSQLDRIVNAVQAGKLEAPAPPNQEAARLWLEQMAAMALADGFLADPEREALQRLGRQLGLTAYDVNQVIARKRRELYLAARETLRQS